jgi:hypothetical protein
VEVGDFAVEAADFAGVEALPSALEEAHPMTHSERGRSPHHPHRSYCEWEEEQGATAVVRGACRWTDGWVLAAVEEVALRALPEVATGEQRVMLLVSESNMIRQQECCRPRFALSCETSAHLCVPLQMRNPCRSHLHSQSRPRFGQALSVVPLLDGRAVQLWAAVEAVDDQLKVIPDFPREMTICVYLTSLGLAHLEQNTRGAFQARSNQLGSMVMMYGRRRRSSHRQTRSQGREKQLAQVQVELWDVSTAYTWMS